MKGHRKLILAGLIVGLLLSSCAVVPTDEGDSGLLENEEVTNLVVNLYHSIVTVGVGSTAGYYISTSGEESIAALKNVIPKLEYTGEYTEVFDSIKRTGDGSGYGITKADVHAYVMADFSASRVLTVDAKGYADIAVKIEGDVDKIVTIALGVSASGDVQFAENKYYETIKIGKWEKKVLKDTEYVPKTITIQTDINASLSDSEIGSSEKKDVDIRLSMDTAFVFPDGIRESAVKKALKNETTINVQTDMSIVGDANVTDGSGNGYARIEESYQDMTLPFSMSTITEMSDKEYLMSTIASVAGDRELLMTPFLDSFEEQLGIDIGADESHAISDLLDLVSDELGLDDTYYFILTYGLATKNSDNKPITEAEKLVVDAYLQEHPISEINAIMSTDVESILLYKYGMLAGESYPDHSYIERIYSQSTNMSVPGTIEGRTVKGLWSLSNNGSNGTITIPESISYIPAGAIDVNGYKDYSRPTVFTVNGLNYGAYPLTDSVATLIGPANGTQYEGSLTIPATVTYNSKTYNVMTISKDAFEGCTGITGTVTIPSTIKSIGSEAFKGCSGISDIILSSGVRVIGEGAFEGCYGVRTITIADGQKYIDSCFSFGKDGHTATAMVVNAKAELSSKLSNEYTVLTYPPTSVDLDKGSITIAVGGTEQLTPSVSPSFATDKTVSWSSSNEGIVTVDGNGLVTAVAVGTAKITATTNVGGLKSECNVEVKLHIGAHEDRVEYCDKNGHIEGYTCTGCGEHFADEACTIAISDEDWILPPNHDFVDDECSRCHILRYTVTFMDKEGGIELYSVKVVDGEDAVFAGDAPTKEADVQYTYAFAGWNASSGQKAAGADSLKNVKADRIVYAAFSETLNKYKITFVDGDGNTIQDTEFDYGAKPVYSGETPTKTKDVQYTYVFNDTWSPVIVDVAGEATYTAQFDSVINKYKITFVDGDGNTIQDTEIDYGATPICGVTPTKTKDVQYSYVFDSWFPEIESVTGEATYTAQFTSVLNKYEITFLDGNEDVIMKTEFEYGSTPAYEGDAPVKDRTAQYTFTFNGGWSPEIVNVVGEATYIALFDETVNQYTVTFKSQDGQTDLGTSTVDYGADAEYGGKAPTKEADAQYTYAFAGWNLSTGQNSADGDILENIIDDKTVYAAFSETLNRYTVIWKNEGVVVETDKEVEYGTMPTYDGDTPTKKAEAQCTYEFCCWVTESGEPYGALRGDVTYVATYDVVLSKYTVTFKSQDGQTDLGTSTVDYGTEAFFAGAIPAKEADAQYTYAFAGWNSSVGQETAATEILKNIAADKTVYAAFSKSLNKYTVTFKSQDGQTDLGTSTVDYGTDARYSGQTPTKEADAQYTYGFEGWNSAANQMESDGVLKNITADKTVYAAFSKTVNKYTVQFKSEGNLVSKSVIEYGTVIQAPADPVKASTTQYAYAFTGWAVEGTTATVSFGDVKVTSDVTYVAKFSETARTYTLKWMNGDEVVRTDSNMGYGTPVTKPADPSKQASGGYTYTFIGWNGYSENMTVTCSATFNAMYSSSIEQIAGTGDVSYDVGADEVTLPIQSMDKTGVESLAIGMAEGTIAIDSAALASITGDVKLSINTVGATVLEPAMADKVGDSPVFSINMFGSGDVPITTFGDGKLTITVPYTLQPGQSADDIVVWCISGAEIESFDAVYDAQNKTISFQTVHLSDYAIVEKCTVRFVSGTETVSESKVAKGAVIEAPSIIPTKEPTAEKAFAFLKWEGFYVGMTVTGDTTFNAVFYEEDKGCVIVWKNGDSVVRTDNLAPGTVITAPEDQTRAPDTKYSSYSFAGWKGFTSGMTATGDMVFTAQFTGTPVEYNLKYVLVGAPAGVQKPADSKVGYGTSVKATVPSVSGYVTEVSLSGGMSISSYNTFDMPDHDVTVTITYTKQVIYVLTLKASPAEGGTVYGADSYVKDTDVSIKAVPNLGYSFIGWADGVSESDRVVKITSNLTYTANFVKNETPVKKVSISSSAINMDVGEKQKLTATVEPSDASDKTVRWTTSDAGVATVDQNGNVTAVSEGQARITVTTSDGGLTAVCIVKVTSVDVSVPSDGGNNDNILMYVAIAAIVLIAMLGLFLVIRRAPRD